MNVSNKNQEPTPELLTPEEFMQRLHIQKSALHVWKAKGWLVPGRHYIKIGNIVRYWWSVDRLLEIHEMANKENEHNKQDLPKREELGGNYGDRVNWEA